MRLRNPSSKTFSRFWKGELMSDTKEEKSFKPIVFTRKDQLFLLDMYDLQFVDVEYLQQNVYKGSSKSTIYRRMNRLEHEGYIKIFRIPVLDYRHGQSKNVYTLDRKGANEVKALLGEVDWRYDVATRTPTHVYHQLLLGHVRAAFQEDRLPEKDEEPIPKHETYELVQYLNEKNGYYRYDPKEDDQPKGSTAFSIRPDGVFVLRNRNTGTCMPFMVELERSYQSKQTTMEKLERYNLYCQYQLYKEKHRAYDFPVGKPRILFISVDPKGVDRLIDHSKDVDTSATNGVLYTTFDELTENPYGHIFYGKDSTDQMKKYSLISKID